MRKIVLFGFSGEKGCGKDTVADYMCLKHHFTKLAFATPLKEAVSFTFHVPMEELGSGTLKDQEFAFPIIVTEFHLSDFLEHLHDNYYEIPEEVKTSIISKYQGTSFTNYRGILQIFGTEICRREIDNDIWITIMRKRLDECPTHRIVLSDVRFKDEKDFVSEMGGKSVIIERPSLNNEDTHVSENNLTGEDYDVIITNDRSVYVLQRQIALWMAYVIDKIDRI